MKMALFHVSFLVSLMWAVHSHGWAYETECNTYSNTQLPYKENKSAETLMPRQLIPVVRYYLVLNWPATFCFRVGRFCRRPIGNNFTVHGLWPQPNGVLHFCCNGNTPLSLYRYLGNQLEDRLGHIWPSLDSRRDSYQFWKHEYDKHGSCFIPTPVQYFQFTVDMMAPLSDLTRTLERQGLISGPGHFYKFKNLVRMIRRATGVIPRLECDLQNRLYQIYFCASNALGHAGALINCENWFNINSWFNINRRCGSWIQFPSP